MLQHLSIRRFFLLGLCGLLLSIHAENASAAPPLIGVDWGNGKAYFFHAGYYTRYDIDADRADPGYPRPIDNRTWPGLPWKGGFDAAVNFGNGKAYFFKGDQYLRYDIAADRADPGYPRTIDEDTWPGLPWKGGFDAAVNFGNGKAYFFKGDQYLRYDIAADRADPGYPRPIDNRTWPGLPWIDGIDSAANFGKGKAYLFRGGSYVRYDIQADRADAGYPRTINNQTWPGLEDLLRRQ